MATAKTNGITIEYDTFGDPSLPALLLVTGLGCQLIHWQDAFCQQIADKGYHVIRYDNRDCGLSTKIDGLAGPDLMQEFMAIFSGQTILPPYTIEDMASDAVGLLDDLNIDNAHICGKSMGGMIAQTFAINNPSRTLSLTSIYSHSGKWQDFPATQEVSQEMMKPAPEERQAYVVYKSDFYKLIYGSGLSFDETFHKTLEGRAYDRSYCPEGAGRQALAIFSQKDRLEDLGRLTAPSLIIHGDEDPLVPLAGGKSTAEAIPGAAFIILKGMGHVLPNLNAYWNDIKTAMIDHIGKV